MMFLLQKGSHCGGTRYIPSLKRVLRPDMANIRHFHWFHLRSPERCDKEPDSRLLPLARGIIDPSVDVRQSYIR